MSEPNFASAKVGDVLMLKVIVTDDHWRDKELYEVQIPTQDGLIKKYIPQRYLWEPEQP